MKKVEDLPNKVGYSERTNAVIEPKLSIQWFCDMKKLAGTCFGKCNERQDPIPSKKHQEYLQALDGEHIKDWCISRQLWWGHRIPAFYYGSGPNDFVIAKTKDEALTKAIQVSKNDNLSLDCC